MSRFRYLVYPGAERKLQKAGIVSRIEKAFKKDDYPNVHHGMMMSRDISGIAKEMKAGGFFKSMPDAQKKSFQTQLNELFKEKDTREWNVIKNDGAHKENVEYEDILLLMGFYSSMVLPKRELFAYGKHGFPSMFAFTGAVGARVWTYDEGRSQFRDGYKWTTTNPDGTVRVNEITGDGNCDLRIFQKDMTPYDTYDPLGNLVEYRPLMRSDNRVIGGYHSTEGGLLVSVLKYVKQLNVRSEILKDRNSVLEFLAWAKSLGQGGGTCAEHFGGFDSYPMNFLHSMDVPLPVLDADRKTDEHTRDYVTTASHHKLAYGLYVGLDQDLVFMIENLEENKKEFAASFHSDESDHLIKGLFFQSARGLGRTSVLQLIQILDFYTSGEYEKEKARMDAEFAKRYPDHGKKTTL